MSTPPIRRTGYRLTSRGRVAVLVAACLIAGVVGYLTADLGLPGWSA